MEATSAFSVSPLLIMFLLAAAIFIFFVIIALKLFFKGVKFFIGLVLVMIALGVIAVIASIVASFLFNFSILGVLAGLF